jgi:peroxiredoxin
MKIGDKIPDVMVKAVTKEGSHDEVQTGALFAGKKAIVFGLPGAFTPTCSSKHLPGYVAQLDDLAKKGVGLVACVSVNDAWTMEAWAKSHGALGKIVMIADGGGAFTRAAGLEQDIPHMGLRSKRWAAIVDDGVVQSIDVDSKGLVDTACEVQLAKV